MSNDDEVARTVEPVEKKSGNVHKVQSSHRPCVENIEAFVQGVRKERNAHMNSTIADSVDTPNNVKEAVKVANHVSKGKSIAKDDWDSVRSAHRPEYLRTCLSQVSGDIDAV